MKLTLQILSCLVFLFALSFFSASNASPTIAQSTPNCADNPPGANAPAGLVWHAFCKDEEYFQLNTTTIYCKVNTDCPVNDAEFESGVGSPSDKFANTAWCYNFSAGPRCLQLRNTKNTSTDFKTPQDLGVSKAQQASSDNKQIIFGGISLGESAKDRAIDDLKSMKFALEVMVKKIETKINSLVDPKAKSITQSADAQAKKLDLNKKIDDCLTKVDDQKSQCFTEIGNQFHGLKVAYRLADFYEMTSGNLKNTCVKADLGVKPRLAGKSYDKHAELRRLLLCTSSDGQTLKWRVMPTGGTADLLTADKALGTGRVRVTEIAEVEEDVATQQWVVKKVVKQFAVSASGPSSGIGSADEVKTFLQPQITAAIAELKQAGISTGQ